VVPSATSAIGLLLFSMKSLVINLLIDYETDAIIQESLRKEVAKDISVLTIAHRLHTVMDSDKIVSFSDVTSYYLLLIIS
jgi:ABC-type transport system involved in Fe-S cluster assembly fused permease/ATPase subunit